MGLRAHIISLGVDSFICFAGPEGPLKQMLLAKDLLSIRAWGPLFLNIKAIAFEWFSFASQGPEGPQSKCSCFEF